MTDLEKQAVERVKQAGVEESDAVILSFVRTPGPEAILRASLSEILEVANCF